MPFLFVCVVLLMLAPHAVWSVFFYDEASNHTLDLRMGRKQVETALRYLEAHRFREAMTAAKQQGYTIRGFYHTSIWRGGAEWKAVMAEQLGLVDGKREHLNNIYDRESSLEDNIEWGKKQWPSLLRVSDKLHVTVSGTSRADLDKVVSYVDELGLSHRDKLSFTYNQTQERGAFHKLSQADRDRLVRDRPNLSEGESATFMALHDYCSAQSRRGRKALVYYFHLKGSCCTRRTEQLSKRHVTTWREAMNAFTLEFPSICLRAMVDGYDSCGMENQGGTYSGNFWWATCDHVARVPQLTDLEKFDAYKVEYAIQKYSSDASKNEDLGAKCGYSAYNCNANHYTVECTRSSYLHKLLQYSQLQALPYNFEGTKGEWVWNQKQREYDVFKPKILEECRKRRERPL